MKQMWRRLAMLACLAALGGCETMGAWPDGQVSPFMARQEQAVEEGTAPIPVSPTQSRQIFLEMVAGLQARDLHRAALAYLDEFDGKYPGDEGARLMRARSLSALGRSAEAELVYWDLIKTRHTPAAYNGLGIVAARQGRWVAAEQEFRQAVTLKPTNAGFLNNLGHAQLRLGRVEEARQTLLQSLELRPGDLSGKANLVLSVHLAGQPVEAERMLRDLAPADRKRIEGFVADYLVQTAPTAAAPTNLLPEPGE